MPAPRPLHPDLGDVFRVAAALESRHSRHRLTRGDLIAPYRGVRRRSGARSDELTALWDYVPLMREGDRFSHLTAATIWSAPVPPSSATALHIAASRGAEPRSPGVVGHRVRDDDRTIRNGLPVSTAVRTFLELSTAMSLDDLVAVGDHLVLDPAILDPADLRPWVSASALKLAADQYHGRGARRAREAARMVRAGAESRTETLLRLLLLRAGLPEPALNLQVVDARSRVIGRFDLVWVEQRVIVEYDGDQHRTSTYQYERDIRRFDRASDDGWRVIKVRSRGLFREPTATVARVARALRGGPG